MEKKRAWQIAPEEQSITTKDMAIPKKKEATNPNSHVTDNTLVTIFHLLQN